MSIPHYMINNGPSRSSTARRSDHHMFPRFILFLYLPHFMKDMPTVPVGVGMGVGVVITFRKVSLNRVWLSRGQLKRELRFVS